MPPAICSYTASDLRSTLGSACGSRNLPAGRAGSRTSERVTSHHNPATGFRRNPASCWGADEHLARVQGWLGLGAGATERDFGEVGAIFGAR